MKNEENENREGIIELDPARRRTIRFLNALDEYTHECLASVPLRSWRNDDVIELLFDLMLAHGVPEYMRSDNGSEFTAKQIREWLGMQAPSQPILNQVGHGKTVISKASMLACELNSWMQNFSIPCSKRRC
ncbi:MAG: hypothetical protein PHT84_04665 [Candidatus Pacebacteria bacterium]|nr:hypothetical protein [Candidatus Paceibacterota bacterium]